MIAVDLFAGGGGASLGIQQAGLEVVLAVNHDEHAITMHAANHPDTIHMREDVFAVDPQRAACGRLRRGSVDLLWLSPSCTHHSRAKGGVPRSEQLRSLAWVGVEWARTIAPRVIALENVPEFSTWGPLGDDGLPVRERTGETFRDLVSALRLAGYAVEWRTLNAADYGAPTARKRLFLVARRDGHPIVWPTPTHGPGRSQPWRTAAECIDWSVPVPSIFGRSKPLAEATERRIAEGLRRYVLTAARPFIVCLTHGARLESCDEPLRTTTAAPRGERVLVAPTLVQTGYGERAGQSPRALDIGAPLGTVVAGGAKHGLVAAFIAKHYGGVVGHGIDRPLGTITAQDHHSLIAAHITKFYGTSTGSLMGDPLPTVTGGGQHAGLVAAFLLKYYGQGGQWSGLDEPMHTLVTKARMGLVTVTIGGEEYAVVDIGLRMLTPRELARAQGFPDSYLLTGTKTQQIARIGNSVCPPVARAVVEAQFGRRKPIREAA